MTTWVSRIDREASSLGRMVWYGGPCGRCADRDAARLDIKELHTTESDLASGCSFGGEDVPACGSHERRRRMIRTCTWGYGTALAFSLARSSQSTMTASSVAVVLICSWSKRVYR